MRFEVVIVSNYIYNKVNQLVKRYRTRDPFEILSALHVVVKESNNFQKLKGYCFVSCRTVYVVINSFLPEAEKRIVAAHELGHVILHKQALKMAPMRDSVLYDMRDNTEYEANLFAADLLLEDQDIEDLSHNEEMDYFSLCSSLYSTPELMSFKLFSLIRRGHAYRMPLDLDSKFLAKGHINNQNGI